jgi:alpha-L-rhamnosidase
VGEGFVDPLGFHDARPVFSWKLPEGVKKQSAYRIEATAGGGGATWDSGWVTSDQSTFVPYGGAPLASRQQVQWRVNFRDGDGKESGWSVPAHFELGLLSAGDWKAKWIRPAQAQDPVKEPVASLRRTFSITKPVARARAYVTAKGVFELQLNGQRVGNDHFANGFTAYQQRLDTLTYDVTGQLRPGENSLDALLGAGWYAGRFPFQAKTKGPYGKNPELLVQVEIAYEDGTSDTIASDEKWGGTFTGPIVASSIYDGEEYDARRRPADWAPVVAEANLGSAALAPKPFPPVREVGTLAVQTITEPQPGRYVFDLGQNMVGWARVKMPVEKDKTVTMRFAEMLKNDGTLYTENYRTAKSTDTYTAAETGTVEWQPHFTFHGFRYVELSGLPAGVTPQKDWVTGVVLHSDLPTIGTFSASHARLNQLQSNITWGWRGNSLDIPTDCPQRDERMGWTGDAQVFCATSMFNTGAHAFWKSWLGSMRIDQYKDGAIPSFVPTAMSKWESRSPGWTDAGTIIPWDVYVRTGDTRLLAENFGMMERLVGWYRAQAVDGLVPKIGGLGDWLQPYQQTPPNPRDNMSDRKGDTPIPFLGAAFYARSARILADSARALGRTEEAKRYGDEAAGVRAAITKEYFDGNGKLRISPETQTAYVLAISFDLIPDELKPKAGEHLARLVREADGHLRTGFLGTPFIAEALDRAGHADLAAEVLFTETYPSWFYSINQGATTMWERWNSYTKDKGFGDVSMNSFNHYAYGAIGQWMYERIAGLAPDPARPGYKHFFVRPLVIKQLDSARAELETPYGKAVSAWTKKEGKVDMEVVVPPNTTATVEFPDRRTPQTVPAGTYHFESSL